MDNATDLLLRIQRLLGNLGSDVEQLDEISREMLLHVSEAQSSGRPTRVSNICRIARFGSFPTAHRRLKKLIEMGLLQSDLDPGDARVLIVSLTPKSKKLIRKIADEVRQVVYG